MISTSGLLLTLNIPQRKYLTDSNLFIINNIPGYIPEAHVDPVYDAVHTPHWYLQVKSTKKGMRYRICMRFPKTRKMTYCGQIELSDEQLEEIMGLNDEQVLYRHKSQEPRRSKFDRFLP